MTLEEAIAQAREEACKGDSDPRCKEYHEFLARCLEELRRRRKERWCLHKGLAAYYVVFGLMAGGFFYGATHLCPGVVWATALPLTLFALLGIFAPDERDKNH